MAIVFTNDEHYGDIADAIRLKNGTQTTYRPDEMAAAIEAIPGGLTPTGTIQITQNGNYNVTNFAEANVAVPGIVPAGVKSITEDGTYDVTTYATANVNTKPAKGVYFYDYDASGFPTKWEFIGSEIPEECFYNGSVGVITRRGFFKHMFKATVIPNTITTIGNSAFRNCTAFNEPFTIPASVTSIGYYAFGSNTTFQTLIFAGNVPNINSMAFNNCNQMTLADFSNHTGAIPTLYSADSFEGKAGQLVIRVPAALLEEWSTATNWIGVDATWEGV